MSPFQKGQTTSTRLGCTDSIFVSSAAHSSTAWDTFPWTVNRTTTGAIDGYEVTDYQRLGTPPTIRSAPVRSPVAPLGLKIVGLNGNLPLRASKTSKNVEVCSKRSKIITKCPLELIFKPDPVWGWYSRIGAPESTFRISNPSDPQSCGKISKFYQKSCL